MKNVYISMLMGCMACFANTQLNAQEFKEHSSKEFAVSSHPVLAVYNISGSVKVEGYAGNKIIFDIDKTISAKSAEDLETGKKEFKFGFDQSGDTIEAYVSDPQDSRPHNDWNGNWRDRRIKYRYNLEITVKVPLNTNLVLSTVNNGDIHVNGVTGKLDLSNVNGSITAIGVKGITDAHTVNGGVTVSYTGVPADASSYESVNGDLRVTYPGSLSADMEFKSLNGSFYTDFPEVETLPFKVVKKDEANEGGTEYKLDKNSNFRFGKGGKTFRFETVNGSVYIKKQS